MDLQTALKEFALRRKWSEQRARQIDWMTGGHVGPEPVMTVPPPFSPEFYRLVGVRR